MRTVTYGAEGPVRERRKRPPFDGEDAGRPGRRDAHVGAWSLQRPMAAPQRSEAAGPEFCAGGLAPVCLARSALFVTCARGLTQKHHDYATCIPPGSGGVVA